jgi:hypothetical protein
MTLAALDLDRRSRELLSDRRHFHGDSERLGFCCLPASFFRCHCGFSPFLDLGFFGETPSLCFYLPLGFGRSGLTTGFGLCFGETERLGHLRLASSLGLGGLAAASFLFGLSTSLRFGGFALRFFRRLALCFFSSLSLCFFFLRSPRFRLFCPALGLGLLRYASGFRFLGPALCLSRCGYPLGCRLGLLGFTTGFRLSFFGSATGFCLSLCGQTPGFHFGNAPSLRFFGSLAPCLCLDGATPLRLFRRFATCLRLGGTTSLGLGSAFLLRLGRLSFRFLACRSTFGFQLRSPRLLSCAPLRFSRSLGLGLGFSPRDTCRPLGANGDNLPCGAPQSPNDAASD